MTEEEKQALVMGHLKRAVYERASEEEKQAAWEMAERDIELELGEKVPEQYSVFFKAAVVEQAIFLLEEQANRAKGILSESVEGVGSVTYRNGGGVLGERARRVVEYLRGGSVRLVR